VVDYRKLNFTAPDRTVEFPLTRLDIVELGDFTIARVVHQPGWRWSLHVKPLVGGDWCRARHIGAVVSGHGGIVFSDGTRVEVRAGDAVDLPPLHDAWVLGEEPLVQIEFTGTNTFLGSAVVPWLATLLFTDIVDSTLVASRVGDVEWRELLADHYRTNRAILDRFGGSEVTTTGDGFLATFESPASAIAAAAAIADAANRAGLRIRAGVHVGEVQRVGNDVRGVAVHEAARIMATAGPDEIMVSDTTRVLAAGVPVEDRGLHVLKGLDGERRLFAVTRQSRSRADDPAGG
jgi:class 3 adenylate cyclase